MTRINLVPPEELMDQHLFAEFREIKMVPKALQRSLNSKSITQVLNNIPSEFTLNTGHVTFFYNKGKYLLERYEQIKKELDRRNVQYNKNSIFDPDCIMVNSLYFYNDYTPTQEALSIIRERIQDRINEKPYWYKYYGSALPWYN